jgi:rod shape-determining protein MreC
VATVNEVVHDSGQPFAIVRAVPTAALNRSRYMLLVFTDGRTAEQRATEAAEAQEAADREAADSQAKPETQAAPATAQPQGAPSSAAPAQPAAAPASAAPAAPAVERESE